MNTAEKMESRMNTAEKEVSGMNTAEKVEKEESEKVGKGRKIANLIETCTAAGGVSERLGATRAWRHQFADGSAIVFGWGVEGKTPFTFRDED